MTKEERQRLLDRVIFLLSFDSRNKNVSRDRRMDILETWAEYPNLRKNLNIVARRLATGSFEIKDSDLAYLEYVENGLKLVNPHVEVMKIPGQDYDFDVDDALVVFETVKRDIN
jgi:hypothetical protein